MHKVNTIPQHVQHASDRPGARPRRGLRSRAASLAAAVLVLVAAGCGTKWNQRERQAVMQAVERVRASAEAAKKSPPPAMPPAAARQAATPAEVRLTLHEAIRLALSHNQDVQIAGYAPLLAETDLVRAQAIYDPNLFLSNTFGRTNRPIQNQLDTGVVRAGSLLEDTWAFRGGLKQAIPTGGAFSISQEMNYLDSNSHLVMPNPQYTSRTIAEVNQPLLKGFGDYTNRAAIRIANLNTDASLQEFRQKVMDVIAKVVTAYWQLALDLEMVRVSRTALEMAQEVLRRETVRKQQGVSNDLSVARATSAVASRQADLVRAENRARTSGDQLRRLLNAPEVPVEADISVIPVDPPRFFLVEVDRTAAIAKALSRRPELERAKAIIAMNQIRVDVADRDRLPKLDAVLRYTMHGLGNDLGASLDSQHYTDPFSWTAGLEFEWPLGGRVAEAERQKRRLEYEQALLQADQAADQVVQEVSAAVRSVLRGRDEVESTLKAKTAAQQVVHGEKIRFELGELTNEELLRAQDNLASADRDHVQAVLNFNLSLTELGRAQGTLLEDLGIEIVWPAETRGRPLPLGVVVPEKPPAAGP